MRLMPNHHRSRPRDCVLFVSYTRCAGLLVWIVGQNLHED